MSVCLFLKAEMHWEHAQHERLNQMTPFVNRHILSFPGSYVCLSVCMSICITQKLSQPDRLFLHKKGSADDSVLNTFEVDLDHGFGIRIRNIVFTKSKIMRELFIVENIYWYHIFRREVLL